jgi:eukaryotic-like serine/threonine-protein kinase
MTMQQLGKYTLGRPIGQGGMGAVYESFHPQLNRPVALKVMHASLAADPQGRQRFLREAQMAAGLSHPGVVNIFDVDEHGGVPFIVMEKLESGSLAGRLARGSLPVDEALGLVAALAEALDYAHRQGVIHRDLKPANVLLRPDGSPVLADFGLARPAMPSPADRITTTGTMMGTLAYMAPEQFRGAEADARSDIYMLGVLLYELLAGRLPFDGDAGQVLHGHLQEAPPAIRAANPQVPPDAELLTLRMLAKDPLGRPQTAGEVARALHAIRSGAAIAAATGPTIVAPAPSVTSGAPAIGPTVAAPASGAAHAAPAIGPTIALPNAVPATGVAAPAPERGLGRWGRRTWTLAGIGAGVLAVALGLWLSEAPSGTPAFQPSSGSAGASSLPELTPVPLRLVEQPKILGAEPAGAGPEQFSVGGMSYREGDDNYWFFGEVRNDGPEAREGVEVRVLLLDESGRELLSKTGYAERSYLAPGDISPFSVLFTDDGQPLPEFSSYRAEVRSSRADFEQRTTVRELRVSDLVTGEAAYSGSLSVRGQVRNESDRDAQFTEVLIVLYDEAGTVVGMGSAYAEDGEDGLLRPGESGPFNLSYIVTTDEATSYYVVAEAKHYD